MSTEKEARYDLEARNQEGLTYLTNIGYYHIVEMLNSLIDAGYTKVTVTLRKDDGD